MGLWRDEGRYKEIHLKIIHKAVLLFYAIVYALHFYTNKDFSVPWLIY